MTDQEFFSFILYWLCKFFFYVSSQRIMPEFAPLAKALALKKKIALTPYVLGHVYRACSQFCEKPLDINQVWLFAYFTDLHSRCLKFLVQDPTTCWEKYARVSLYPSSFAYYLTFIYQLPAFPLSTFFCPFKVNIGPAWLKTFLADKRCSRPLHRYVGLQYCHFVWFLTHQFQMQLKMVIMVVLYPWFEMLFLPVSWFG